MPDLHGHRNEGRETLSEVPVARSRDHPSRASERGHGFFVVTDSRSKVRTLGILLSVRSQPLMGNGLRLSPDTSDTT